MDAGTGAPLGSIMGVSATWVTGFVAGGEVAIGPTGSLVRGNANAAKNWRIMSSVVDAVICCFLVLVSRFPR